MPCHGTADRVPPGGRAQDGGGGKGPSAKAGQDCRRSPVGKRLPIAPLPTWSSPASSSPVADRGRRQHLLQPEGALVGVRSHLHWQHVVLREPSILRQDKL